MTALATLSPAAQHYTDQLHQSLALKLVDALAALERAQMDAEKAHRYCGPEDQQKCDIAALDARVEVCRLMDQLGLDARVVAGALA